MKPREAEVDGGSMLRTEAVLEVAGVERGVDEASERERRGGCWSFEL